MNASPSEASAIVAAWGAVAQAVFTFLAVVAAVWAGIWAKRAYETSKADLAVSQEALEVERKRDRVRDKRDRAERRAAIERDRRALAERVTGWWPVGENTLRDAQIASPHILNASGEPIYDVAINGIYEAHVDEIAGTPDVDRSLVIPPGSEPFKGRAIQIPKFCTPRLQIHFTDARGVKWTKDEYGHLTERP